MTRLDMRDGAWSLCVHTDVCAVYIHVYVCIYPARIPTHPTYCTHDHISLFLDLELKFLDSSTGSVCTGFILFPSSLQKIDVYLVAQV